MAAHTVELQSKIMYSSGSQTLASWESPERLVKDRWDLPQVSEIFGLEHGAGWEGLKQEFVSLISPRRRHCLCWMTLV